MPVYEIFASVPVVKLDEFHQKRMVKKTPTYFTKFLYFYLHSTLLHEKSWIKSWLKKIETTNPQRLAFEDRAIRRDLHHQK